MYTLTANIIFICASFRNRNKSEPLASSSILLRSDYKLIVYLPTMYVYYIYSAMLKFPNNRQIVLKKNPEQTSF